MSQQERRAAQLRLAAVEGCLSDPSSIAMIKHGGTMTDRFGSAGEPWEGGHISDSDIAPLFMELSTHGQAVRDALSAVLENLSAQNLGAADCDTVEIILAEVMNNIVEHGYPNGQDGWIKLWAWAGRDEVFFCLVDGGVPMPGLALPEGKQVDLDVPLEDFPEGGFGWNMIRRMTTSLEYQRAGGRNHLKFGIPRGVPA